MLTWCVTLLALGACDIYDVRATLYYNFSQLEEPAPDTHYQQFAEVDGYPVDLGCFVVDMRQLNCFDATVTGTPNLRPAVVECECPCGVSEPDPCGGDQEVTAGTIRGVVDHSDATLRLGGAEFPTAVVLDDATELFITIEPDGDDDPRPSLDVVLEGALRRDGTALRGELTSPTVRPIEARVTVVPTDDGAWL